jgi:hypothetical protein
MKKILSISIFAISLLILPKVTLAQGNQRGQSGTQQRIQDPTTHKDEAIVSPQSDKQGQSGTQQKIQDPTTHEDATIISPQGNQRGQSGQQVKTGNKGIETAIQNLDRVAKRNNNPEIGEQVRSMVQNHEKVQARTKTALKTMSKRNTAIKFIIGPDYKNAGQVRSDVVSLKNDIKKLEQTKKNVLPAETEDIQEVIDELEVEANELESQLTEQLSGFSLFGWLSKLLTK